MRPVAAIIGTARDEYVHRCLKELSGMSKQAVVKEERIGSFIEKDYEIHTFKGSISWKNLSLLRVLRRINPDIIVFVIGDQFHHHNVVKTLRFWKSALLLPKVEILACYSFDPSSLVRLDNEPLPPPIPGPASHIWPFLTAYDPIFGWRLRPVRLSRTIMGKTSAWQMTIDSTGRRVTSAKGANPNSGKPVVAFHGGSEIFAPWLSDERTLPWLVQSLAPEFSILNSAAPDHSNAKSILKLEWEIRNIKPKTIVYSVSPDGAGDAPGPAASASFSADCEKVTRICKKVGNEPVFLIHNKKQGDILRRSGYACVEMALEREGSEKQMMETARMVVEAVRRH